MPVAHVPWLVGLSIVMAIQGAYVGLSLAVGVTDARGLTRRLLLAGAAFSLALAIWTMHFVGMLALRLPFAVDYLVFPTLLSFLVCALVVGAAVYATAAGPPTPRRLALAATLMGLGIFTMHYIGMRALHASAHMAHAGAYVAASLAIAIAASGLALWLAAGRGGRPPLVLSAVAFGMAVSGMHYTAMAGMTLYPHAEAAVTAPALSGDLLAIVVAVVAFCVSGIFLLTLVPDRTVPALLAPAGAPAPLMAAAGEVAADAAPAAAVAATTYATYAPLGGAGAPKKRFAVSLPIERDGGTRHVAVDDVVAIHANAHYTYVFDGRERLFCPLAIGDVAQRLDGERFVRIHRSHIVALDRVISCRRHGDSEMVELAAASPYAVPVSRSRAGWLKARIGAGRAAAVGRAG